MTKVKRMNIHGKLYGAAVDSVESGVPFMLDNIMYRVVDAKKTGEKNFINVTIEEIKL